MAARVPAALRRAQSAVRGRPLVPARLLARGRPRLPRRLRGRGGRLAAFLALLGPGLIAANAGNDAGGIATYSQVGAKYGYDLLWMMVLITFSLALVQMLAARMGVVTGKGLAELVRESYGIRWSAFATMAVLIANLGICVSDFVGVGAALGLAGIPPQVSVPIAAVVIWLIIVRGSYRSAEKIFIWLTIPFFAYPIAAILAHPHWLEVGRALAPPHIQTNSAYLLLFVATAGTTITPYMQLYLQSATVERGVRIEELPNEQRQAISGAIFADLVAAFIIVATGATLFRHGIHSISGASDAAKALEPFAGRYAEALFGVGLLGASLLACAILPIATSYVVAESLGFEKGLGHRPGEAPVFVGVITAMILVATIVAVIPGIPVIGLLVGVQVVNGVLLPINLFFIWRLSRSRRIMGEHRNRGMPDALAAVTVAVTSTLSIVLVVVTVAGLL
jgi:NRAMP (natural resistance-associated macrophage protein)-like metal ion transporter